MQVSMDIPDMLRAKRASEIYSQVGVVKLLRTVYSDSQSHCILYISGIDTFFEGTEFKVSALHCKGTIGQT